MTGLYDPHPYEPSQMFIGFCSACGATEGYWTHEGPFAVQGGVR